MLNLTLSKVGGESPRGWALLSKPALGGKATLSLSLYTK